MSPRPVPTRVAVVLGWSVLVWVSLWHDLSVANVLGGAVVGLVTLWLVPLTGPVQRLPVRPWLAIRFVVHFTAGLIRASAVVAWEVVTPRNRITEGIVAIPLRTSAPGLITVIANSLTLTPGTVTVDVRRDPPTLYVHVLHLSSLDAAREEVRRLEDRVLAAFGPRPERDVATDGEPPT